MKEIFSKENTTTLVIIVLGVALAVLVAIPILKNFIPAGLLPTVNKTATTTTTPAATTT
jgi:hypothetical protein